MDDDQRRIARARLLRRQGKTYDEIRSTVGGVSDDRLQRWLRGIPRPAETWRSRAKLELRRECRRLRAQGMSYSEIAAATGASQGSISLWVHDVPCPNRARLEEKRRAAAASASTTRRAAADRLRLVQGEYAASAIGPLSDRELFLVGVALYWAEGSKSKPYQRRERVTFVNSDRTVIAVFLAWLRLVGISVERCRFRVAIHETARVADAQAYWAEIVGVPERSFSRTTLKRHRPQTNRLNIGADYRGCLVVSVRRSATLYRFIAGWWTGIERQATDAWRRGSECPTEPPWRTWQRFER